MLYNTENLAELWDTLKWETVKLQRCESERTPDDKGWLCLGGKMLASIEQGRPAWHTGNSDQ